MDSTTENRIMTLLPFLDEKQRRLYLAAEVESIGFGGLKAIHELTGVSKKTIIRGKKELAEMLLRKNVSAKVVEGENPSQRNIQV
jgi:hypothetical protein